MGTIGHCIAMPKRATFKPVKVPGRPRPWKVEIPARLSLSGTRERYFFETQGEAKNHAEKETTRIKNFGTQGGGLLTPSETEQAINALALLKPYKVSLNEVAQDWIARHVAASASEVFSVASAAFEEHLTTKKIKKRPISKSYRRTVKYTFPRFSKLHKRVLSEITPTMIAECMEGMTPEVRRTFHAVLSSFFEWCIEIPREWLKENPMAKVPKESTGGGEVQVFENFSVQKLFAKLETSFHDLVIYNSLGFFGGIRPDELPRVGWPMIDIPERTISLPPAVTKTGKGRHIEINDTLLAWLEWYISLYGIGVGLIVNKVNLRKRLEDFREAAKVTWIQDGARHTFASNWMAIHKDEHRLRELLGHRSADQLWDHYHKAVKERDAKVFWDILPGVSKIVKFEEVAA